MAYVKTQGVPHFSVKSSSHILEKPYDFWQAINIDTRPDADAVIFGKKTRGGVKLSGIGHDGDGLSKLILINHLLDLLKKQGFWLEASHPVSAVMLKKQAPVVTDYDKLQKLFPDSKFVEKFEDGSYIRTDTDRAGGKTNREYLFGNPTL